MPSLRFTGSSAGASARHSLPSTLVRAYLSTHLGELLGLSNAKWPTCNRESGKRKTCRDSARRPPASDGGRVDDTRNVNRAPFRAYSRYGRRGAGASRRTFECATKTAPVVGQTRSRSVIAKRKCKPFVRYMLKAIIIVCVSCISFIRDFRTYKVHADNGFRTYTNNIQLMGRLILGLYPVRGAQEGSNRMSEVWTRRALTLARLVYVSIRGLDLPSWLSASGVLLKPLSPKWRQRRSAPAYLLFEARNVQSNLPRVENSLLNISRNREFKPITIEFHEGRPPPSLGDRVCSNAYLQRYLSDNTVADLIPTTENNKNRHYDIPYADCALSSCPWGPELAASRTRRSATDAAASQISLGQSKASIRKRPLVLIYRKTAFARKPVPTNDFEGARGIFTDPEEVCKHASDPGAVEPVCPRERGSESRANRILTVQTYYPGAIRRAVICWRRASPWIPGPAGAGGCVTPTHAAPAQLSLTERRIELTPSTIRSPSYLFQQ
ncbi:hypothetical protein EVAR_12923_1 [Eumeta japonica]|uniref:Uncharacterized protein n=1 Tax=Eumeta variegata TaxID=151549 RepID=A0A4C1TVT7_EUMVA|nr:hypothetical protein EVAR_12923_1 [Eumeta japonica]